MQTKMFSKLSSATGFGLDGPLQQWQHEQKELSKALVSTGKQYEKVAKTMAVWGKPEAEDIKFITEKLSTLHMQANALVLSLAHSVDQARIRLTALKTEQDVLQTLKKRQRELQAKVDGKKDDRNARADLANLDREVMAAHASFESMKREVFQKNARDQWDSTIEFCGKMLVVAHFANHVGDQIPQGTLAPGYDLPAFRNQSTITQIMRDYESQLQLWTSYIPADINYSQNPVSVSGESLPSSIGASVEKIPAPALEEVFSAEPVGLETPQRRIPSNAVTTPEIYVASVVNTSAMPTPDHRARQGSITAPNAFKTSASLDDLAMQTGSIATAVPALEDPYDAAPVDFRVPASGGPGTVHPAATASPPPRGPPPPPSGRPRSALATAIYEAMVTPGPLGDLPGEDDKKLETNPLLGVTTISESVTHMLQQPLLAVQAVVDQSNAVGVEGQVGDVRYTASPAVTAKRTSLAAALAQAESGSDEQKGLGVAKHTGSVGDGVTDMLREVMEQQQQQHQQPQPQQHTTQPSLSATQISAKEAANTGDASLGVFVVMFQYQGTPGKTDEVSIEVGDLITAKSVYEDGWGYGCVQRTNAVGFFPFNAVYPVLSSVGRPIPEHEVPATVGGVVVSPSPSILHAEGVLSKQDYERIVGKLKELGAQ